MTVSAPLWRCKQRKESVYCIDNLPTAGAWRMTPEQKCRTAKKAGKGKQSSTEAGSPGPKPSILKLSGNWRDAVKKSLTKKKPADGWPK